MNVARMETGIFKNLKNQLIIFGIVVSMFILLSGHFYFRQQKRETQEEKYNELRAIGQLKSNQLSQWYQERLSEANFFSTGLPYTQYAKSITERKSNEENLFRDALSRIMTNKRYENIYLLDEKGKLLFSVLPDFIFEEATTATWAKKVFQRGTIIVRDFYFCEIHQNVHYQIIAPIADEDKRVIAALVFNVNPYDYLYPLIQAWPTSSETAETILVRQEGDTVWYLNDLRHLSNADLRIGFSLNQTEKPAVRAALGETGFFEGPDYVSHIVLGDISKIPNTPWYLIVKTDISEVYAELNKRAMLVIIIDFLSIFFIGLTIIMLYHNRQRNIYKKLLINTSALYQSQKEFGAILYSIGDGVITTDNEGYVTHLNPVAERLTGWNEQEAKNRNIEEIFHIVNEETRARVENPGKKVLREGQIVGLANHTMLISRNGDGTPISDSGAPIKDAHDNIIGVVMIFNDQTEERRQKEALKESEEKHRNLVSKMQLGLAVHEIITDIEGNPVDYRFLYVNPAYERLTGLKSDDIMGRTVLEILPNTEKIWIERFCKTAITGMPDSFESYAQELHKFYSVLAYRYRQNEFAVIVEDITERKKTENALRESEKNYRELINGMNETVWVIDFEGNIIDVNKTAVDLLGYSKEELIGRNLVQIDSSLTGDAIANLAHTMPVDKLQIFETSHQTKEGRVFPVEIYSSLINYKGKKAILSIARDTTLRKQMEERLRKNEETIRLLFDSTAEGIYMIDMHGDITFCNKSALSLLGYNRTDELIGMNMHHLIHHPVNEGSTFPEKTYKIMQPLGNATHNDNEVFRRKDGSCFPAEYWSYPVKSDDQIIGSVITFLDVSQRKYDENVQQTLYKIAQTSMTSKTLEELLIVIRNELNKLIDTGNFHAALYDHETDNLQCIYFVSELHDGNDKEAENVLCRQLIKSGKTLLLREDDIIRTVSGNSSGFSGPVPVCWIGVPLTDDQKTIGIIVVQSYTNPKAYNEKSALLLEMVATQLSNVIQRSKMIQALISAKEKAEESDRLQSAFLANMSHEIRTPMNGILGFLELLSEPDLEEENKKEYIEIVNNSGRRLLNTINDIIEISKIEAGQSKVSYGDVNIGEVMKFHYDFFLPQAIEKGLAMNVSTQIMGPQGLIRTDRHKLDGILTNLIKNAIKFTEKGTIEFGNYLENEWLVFYIKDSGRGISKDRFEAIFERFVQADQNLTRAHEGSGLGLSITKAHVRALGGKIRVESEPGKGSTFFFTIPYVPVKEKKGANGQPDIHDRS